MPNGNSNKPLKDHPMIRKPLPEGIERRGLKFYHLDCGLVFDATDTATSFPDLLFGGDSEESEDDEEGKAEARARAVYAACKQFRTWWAGVENHIRRLNDGPEGARCLYQHYLAPGNSLPKKEWPPGWVD